MVLLGIDSMIGGMESIVVYLKDEIKAKLRIFGYRPSFGQIKIALAFSYIIFVFFLTSNAGIYYMVFFDRFSAYIPLSFNVLLEIYIFVYIFRFEELETEVQKYTG